MSIFVSAKAVASSIVSVVSLPSNFWVHSDFITSIGFVRPSAADFVFLGFGGVLLKPASSGRGQFDGAMSTRYSSYAFSF